MALTVLHRWLFFELFAAFYISRLHGSFKIAPRQLICGKHCKKRFLSDTLIWAEACGIIAMYGAQILKDTTKLTIENKDTKEITIRS